MLSVKNVSLKYGKNTVLDNINFDLDYGQVVSLLGANGAGKTSLFRSILQIEDKYKGEIFIDGENLKTLKPNQRAKKVAYIPQEYQGMFNYTVEEVVLMGTSGISLFTIPKKEEFKRVKEALDALKISDFGHRKFFELSGGQRQLVLIARALAQKAKILLMDEPASNLDFGNQIYLSQVVKDLAKKGYLVIISTHNPDFAIRNSHKVIILHKHEILAFGDPNKVMTAETLTKVYDKEIQILNIENSSMKTCLPFNSN